jgi:hypothetical protein
MERGRAAVEVEEPSPTANSSAGGCGSDSRQRGLLGLEIESDLQSRINSPLGKDGGVARQSAGPDSAVSRDESWQHGSY